MSFVEVAGVFFAAIACDITWARYTLTVSAHKAFEASLWSVLIMLSGAVNIVAIAGDPWFIAPAAMGAFVGTYYTIKHARRGVKR